MLLKSRDIAFTGVLMGIGVLLVALGGYFEGSTLFFLAAASFLTGVVQRNISTPAAAAFLAGTTLLSFFLTPQKLYCATFFSFGIYVLLAECLEKAWANAGRGKKRAAVWAGKAVIYHVLLGIIFYLSQKLLGWEALFQGKLFLALKEHRILFWVVVLLCAEGLWIVFDRAYFYFQNRYGGLFSKLRQE